MLWLLSARRATAKSFAGCAAAWLSLLLGLRSGAFEGSRSVRRRHINLVPVDLVQAEARLATH